MRITVLFVFALATLTLAMVSCRSTVSGEGIVVETWPTAAPLAGEVPVGRWACVEDFDFEAEKANNDGDYPTLCRALRHEPGGALEFQPDHSGFVLKQYQR